MNDDRAYYDKSWEHVLKNVERAGFLSELQAHAEKTGVSLELLLGRSRWSRVTQARREFYWILRHRGCSLPEIGAMLDRDHTTILSGLNKLIGKGEKS